MTAVLFAFTFVAALASFFIAQARARVVVGGEVYSIVRSANVTGLDGEWVFNNEFFIIMNLAVGGTLGGPVRPDTVFPAEVVVDYVRLFERPQ